VKGEGKNIENFNRFFHMNNFEPIITTRIFHMQPRQYFLRVVGVAFYFLIPSTKWSSTIMFKVRCDKQLKSRFLNSYS